MEDYILNHCRFCKKMLCCVKCRKTHEETVHRINPDCDICVHGSTYLKDFPVSLLNHLKSKHWPLHCVFCNIVFNNLEELAEHNKCPSKTFAMKSPVTPIEKQSEHSPVTPIIKENVLRVPNKIGLSIKMGVTSTPMQSKNLDHLKTPTDQSDIIKSYMFKSSLKLTGSSGTFNESKKSDRRVTFSETPVVERTKLSEPEDSDDSLEESFKSIKNDLFDDAIQCPLECKNAELIPISEETTFESAITTLSRTSPAAIIAKTSKIIRVSEIEIRKEIHISKGNNDCLDDCSALSSFSDAHNSSKNIWTSMRKMVKSVMQNISFSSTQSVKRTTTSDDDSMIEDSTRFKKMKLTDIKCRRTIRDLSPVKSIKSIMPKYVDKATQTEESYFFDGP